MNISWPQGTRPQGTRKGNGQRRRGSRGRKEAVGRVLTSGTQFPCFSFTEGQPMDNSYFKNLDNSILLINDENKITTILNVCWVFVTSSPWCWAAPHRCNVVYLTARWSHSCEATWAGDSVTAWQWTSREALLTGIQNTVLCRNAAALGDSW